MCNHSSFLPACRQPMHPFKTITRMLLAVSLLALSSCSQPGQVSASKPTSAPATTLTSVGSPSSPTPAVSGNPLQTIHMIDATTGWALTNTSVLYTTNGWSTWKDVAPHKAALVVGGYFLSGEEAWIAESEQRPGAIVSHTTDGGLTWQSATLSANVPVDPARMSFINSQDGWIEAEIGGAVGNDLEELFRTTDGGKSWAAVSNNDVGGTFPYGGHVSGITFINASTGWAAGHWLYVTHDGGATWRQQTLQTQGCCLLPTFFNAHDGLLPGGSQLLVTHDGGTTWQPGSLLPESSGLVTFIDLQHGWVAVDNGTTLYRTIDGGTHWAKITPTIAASITSFAQLNFVSIEVGWALGYTSAPPNTLLVRTIDSGHTWKAIFK